VHLRIIGSRYFTIQRGRSKKNYAGSSFLESVEEYLCVVGKRTDCVVCLSGEAFDVNGRLKMDQNLMLNPNLYLGSAAVSIG
jgi:hypothetical protein